MPDMQYDDFTITVAARQGTGYPVAATAPAIGRVASTLPPLDRALAGQLSALVGDGAVYDGAAGGGAQMLDVVRVRAAGAALFRWLMAGAVETHFRLSWDRALRTGRGLRMRLSLDPPELASLPWELLHDPARAHDFATSARTPLIRFLDQADTFGPLVEPAADLPLAMLAVLPAGPGLDPDQQQQVIEEAVGPLRGAINLHVLRGSVTRASLSDTLMAAPFDIVHVTAHGGVLGNETYVQLEDGAGCADWVDAISWSRLFANAHCVKLIVLNACHSGQVNAGLAFHGVAPQLVRSGVPAVVAMQYAISDQAALTFAREFYRQLCASQQSGQIDLAVAHARNILAALFPESLAYAAPVLYTHAPEGVIYRLPEIVGLAGAGDVGSENARLAMFMSSLQSSMDFVDDWMFADREQLETWQRTLQWAEKAYNLHLADASPVAREAARHGLTVTQARLQAVEEMLGVNVEW